MKTIAKLSAAAGLTAILLGGVVSTPTFAQGSDLRFHAFAQHNSPKEGQRDQREAAKRERLEARRIREKNKRDRLEAKRVREKNDRGRDKSDRMHDKNHHMHDNHH